MAAFVGSPASSLQYAAQTSPLRPSGGEVQGELRIARFNYLHAAGNGTGEIDLVKLPPGRICVYSDLSRIVTAEMGANSEMHLGYRAYRQEDGEPVNEDAGAFLNNVETFGGVDTSFQPPGGRVLDFNSQDGVTIFAKVDTGNIEDDNDITGWVAYSRI